MIDREAVRSNAKYLRRVRPIDPEEIAEYIEGYPHPAVVRQTLREEAFDLGLCEREDGTFVPVDEEPLPAQGWSPTAFPEEYAFALEDLLVDAYGANWHVGDSGDRLRAAIRRLKADYYFGNDVEYDAVAAHGYAIYHLPDYYAVIGYVLETIAERGLLPKRLRVLDVGAGSGGPALGLADYVGEDVLIEYHAIEPSAAAGGLKRLLEETGRNVHTKVHETTIESFSPESIESIDSTDLSEKTNSIEPADREESGAETDGPFDLILFGNVLSELDDPAAAVERSLSWLASEGSLIAFEPADLNTATGLREVERAVAPPDGDVTVYAPTLRLWDGMGPSDRGWSFDVRDDLAVPPFQQRLADGSTDGSDHGDKLAGGDESDDTGPEAYINTDVQFAYSVLRTDGERRFQVRSNPRRYARMADMESHVTDRIDLLSVKLSHDLTDGSADRNALFKIGDGSQKLEHYAVLTRETTLNSDLQAAAYGSVLAFENVLVLWNDDEGAYNLVVDDETIVEAIAGR
ncbi:small ribosomal subunit Rsm22 family protein [Halalkalirubrum salinum]|uniref:small ribosomal subunit Rsm22 family protein n=1 Tax=Halalkalirubrum salinum TaxID=2563889 RepID=UPI0010FB12DD|nr:class I SAM-dependent methyltransferase [Halalkalirubrum salinum]